MYTTGGSVTKTLVEQLREVRLQLEAMKRNAQHVPVITTEWVIGMCDRALQNLPEPPKDGEFSDTELVDFMNLPNGFVSVKTGVDDDGYPIIPSFKVVSFCMGSKHFTSKGPDSRQVLSMGLRFYRDMEKVESLTRSSPGT